MRDGALFLAKSQVELRARTSSLLDRNQRLHPVRQTHLPFGRFASMYLVVWPLGVLFTAFKVVQGCFHL
jgi:hypothetical protein